jgi:pilus assembly protein Flp/PilA
LISQRQILSFRKCSTGLKISAGETILKYGENRMFLLNRLIRDDSGSNALEYGLIVAFISLAIVASATTAGTALGDMFSALGAEVGTVTTAVQGA